MTPASLLPLACATLLSTSQLLLSPDVEDEECGANDWLQLSSGHWMPKLGLGTAGLTDPDVVSRADSKFVKEFAGPDYRAKNFTR